MTLCKVCAGVLGSESLFLCLPPVCHFLVDGLAVIEANKHEIVVCSHQLDGIALLLLLLVHR